MFIQINRSIRETKWISILFKTFTPVSYWYMHSKIYSEPCRPLGMRTLDRKSYIVDNEPSASPSKDMSLNGIKISSHDHVSGRYQCLHNKHQTKPSKIFKNQNYHCQLCVNSSTKRLELCRVGWFYKQGWVICAVMYCVLL